MNPAQIWNRIRPVLLRRPLISILLLSLLVRILYLSFNHPLWWDSHIYIGMGKYIFSNGNIGIWESFRPLVHPLILGFFWKIGLNPVVAGKILDLLFSLIVVYLTYLLAHKIFNRTIAIISSLLLSLTPLFIMFTGLILTEPLAMVFGLLGLYLFLQGDRWWHLFFSGFFLSLSFLTKFPQGLFFGGTFLVAIFEKKSITQKIKQAGFLTLGFALPLVPYLIFNYRHYPNFMEPFISGSWIVTTATWLYGSGITYYFIYFFLAIPIYLFFFAYFYYYYTEKLYYDQNKNLLLLITLLTLAYFLYVPRKEVRYLVTILPLLSIMTAFALIRIYQQLSASPKPFVKPQAFVIILTLILLAHLPTALYFEKAPSFEPEIRRMIAEHHLNGTILTTDPAFISFLDLPMVILSGMDFAPAIYQQQKHSYDLLFINDCDLICAPDNQSCFQQRARFLTTLAQENEQIFTQQFIFNKHNSETRRICTYTIYLPKR